MLTAQQLNDLPGMPMKSTTGAALGKIDEIYLDDTTDRVDFLSVSTGKVLKKQKVVPVAAATLTAEEVTVPYDKDTIKKAPEVDIEAGHISAEQEAQLNRHYGVEADAETTMIGGGVSGPSGAGALTRSEDQLDLGTTRRESGPSRLRKFVVTDHTRTVPVGHEAVRVEPVRSGPETVTGVEEAGDDTHKDRAELDATDDDARRR